MAPPVGGAEKFLKSKGGPFGFFDFRPAKGEREGGGENGIKSLVFFHFVLGTGPKRVENARGWKTRNDCISRIGLF